MTARVNWSEKLSQWLEIDAFPLWTGTGLDHATGAVWEALDHDGKPLVDMNRRLRVQARQAFCFAKSKSPDHHAIALQLFRFIMDHGFDPKTDNLASLLGPDCQILHAPHDLYDLAFVLLAAAALVDAGFDIEPDLNRLQSALDRLRAERGWHETADTTARRSQNPHMHLFEAATSLYAATGSSAYLKIAQECLSLFRDIFVDPDGVVREFYSDDWTPLGAEIQEIQPGHIAEWIYLLNRYEAVTGHASGVDLCTMFQTVLGLRDQSGLLPDCSTPPRGTRRLWPQTELFKASIVMQRRGATLPGRSTPEEILALIWRDYFTTPTVGGWFDTRSPDGQLVSQHSPASSFYHILEAFQFYLEAQFSTASSDFDAPHAQRR